MGIKAIVFDMDGTILHSLPDLAVVTNMALARKGYPLRSEHEVLTYVGNGAERLIEQACPPGLPASEVKDTLDLWRALYLEYGDRLTAPFPGIIETLEALRERGVKTAVLSNKFDAAVRALAEDYFPGLFDIARGEIPPTPRKPHPDALLQMLREMGVSPAEAAYVGDTGVDEQVALAAGTMAIGVSWGYDEAIPLDQEKLDAYIYDPRELLDLDLQPA